MKIYCWTTQTHMLFVSTAKSGQLSVISTKSSKVSKVSARFVYSANTATKKLWKTIFDSWWFVMVDHLWLQAEEPHQHVRDEPRLEHGSSVVQPRLPLLRFVGDARREAGAVAPSSTPRRCSEPRAAWVLLAGLQTPRPMPGACHWGQSFAAELDARDDRGRAQVRAPRRDCPEHRSAAGVPAARRWSNDGERIVIFRCRTSWSQFYDCRSQKREPPCLPHRLNRTVLIVKAISQWLDINGVSTEVNSNEQLFNNKGWYSDASAVAKCRYWQFSYDAMYC